MESEGAAGESKRTLEVKNEWGEGVQQNIKDKMEV